MIEIPFYILDVFSAEPYKGNQLAVFHDPENLLDDRAMQLLAREINFAESSFIKEQQDDTTFRVSIYTPECEVPFAGHPTLGTATVIRNIVLPSPPKIISLDLKAGMIPVEFQGEKGFMTQIQPDLGKAYQPKEIADLFSIPVEGIAQLPIQECSTGLPYIIVPLETKDVLGQIEPEAKSISEFLKRHQRHISNSSTQQSTAFYFFCKTSGNENYQGRMICLEQEKVIEDAATGSANGCFLAYLLTHQKSKVNCTVKQGVEMERPSLLYLEGELSQGKYKIRVGGESILIAEGSWKIHSGK